MATESFVGTCLLCSIFISSSQKLKRDIQPVDEKEILTRLVQLPVSEWRYKADENGA